MFGKITKEYEVLVYRDGENPQRPDHRETTSVKREALRIAKSMSRDYPLVEGNVLYYEDGSPVGDELLCIYRNGVRTA